MPTQITSPSSRPPEPAGAFAWERAPWGWVLTCPLLAALARHGFTARDLDPGRGTTVDAAWTAVAAWLGVGVEALWRLDQVHGCRAVRIETAEMPAATPLESADAAITTRADAAVAVKTADCVPILMAHPAGAVAAVHAGWRGTCARAAPAAVSALRSEFGARPENLVVAIGSSIGVCCYEVGPELVDAFAAAGHERHLIDRWFTSTPPPRGSRARNPLRLDVAGANRDQLVLAGVPEEQVHMSGLCTAMHLDVLTSYRAEKEKAGRLVAAIVSGSRPRAPGEPSS